MASRTPLVAGNWKMNKTIAEAQQFCSDLLERMPAPPAGVEVAVCPPFPALHIVAEGLAGSGYWVAAQAVHENLSGAHTGEVSASMIESAGALGTLVGHSERRAAGETDTQVAERVRVATGAGLRVIMCVGESLDVREAEETDGWLTAQVTAGLSLLDHSLEQLVTIAYEPIWAIGTGVVATADQAQEACAHVRLVASNFVDGARLRVLYGGSVSPDNARELMQLPDVDGTLVGGASLDPDKFVRIVEAASQDPVVQAFFKDDGFNFETLIALGGAQYGASDVGEVLTVIDGIKNGDHAGWVREWRAMGDRVRREAAGSTHWRGRALAELRASNYLSLAQAHADGVEDEQGLFERLYEEHRAAWDAFVEWWQPRIREFQIPYEDTMLDAWLFRPDDAEKPRRTLVFNNGSDGPVTAAWVQGIAEALARGWNAVTFDGPGQNSSLVRKQLYFRPDWEAVVEPVVDALVARPEVDDGRLALLGVSQAGYWVPRSLAFEHRFRAAVADPGVVDVSEAMTAHLGHLRTALDAGDRQKFDREMAWGSRFSKSMRYTFAFRFRPYGRESPFDVYRRAQEFRLSDDLINEIRTPLLVTDPDDEEFWPGQPRELYERLPGDKDIVRFTAEEGAGFHCEPVGNAVRSQRIFDWLEEQVPA